VSSRQLNCATNDANNRRDGSSNAGAPILAVIIGISRIVGVVSATRIVAVIRPVMGWIAESKSHLQKAATCSAGAMKCAASIYISSRYKKIAVSGSPHCRLQIPQLIPDPLHILQEHLLAAAVIQFRGPAVGVAGRCAWTHRPRQEVFGLRRRQMPAFCLRCAKISRS
jgi:hypothetical protein